MSRDSAEDLAVSAPTAVAQRPEPPDYFTEREATTWREVVATKPIEWFGADSRPVLVAYVQSIDMHRHLMSKWHELKDAAEHIKQLKGLVDLTNKTANTIAQLATKLRLTQQSRYTPQAASTASKKEDGRRLWQKQ